MLAKLELSGLTSRDATKCGFVPMTTPPAGLTQLPAAGFVIPYFNAEGKRTEFYRYRYLEQPARRGFAAIAQHKESRYIQPAAAVPQTYFPPLFNWKHHAMQAPEDRPIIITEGELKAACATKFAIPALGLGGVWNFKTKTSALIADLEALEWEGVPAYIVYDSDARSNYQVMQAENALATELLNRGAEVFIVRLPELTPGKKTGLDDFLVAEGLTKFTDLTQASEPWEISRALHQLNEEVVFVHDPGAVLELKSFQRMTPSAFAQSIYANRMWEETIPGKKPRVVKRSAAVEWLKWPIRGEVKATTYAPGQPRITAAGELNTWPGWGMNGTTVQEGSIKPWRELIGHLFSGEKPEYVKWFEQWLAYPLQHPGVKLFSAVVMWGGLHGSGKSLTGYTMGRIYGKNFSEIADRDLLGNFNEWAENRQFVMGDEITGGEKRLSGDRMKSLITQRFLRVNPKYISTYTVPDCINYFFTSNHPDSFFLEDSDRRYFVHEVRVRPLSDAFYKEYDKWYKSDAMGALFWYLLNLDLTGFNPSGRPPDTGSKREMIDLGRSDAGAWCAALREDPAQMLSVGGKPLPYSLMTSEELHALFDPQKTSRLTRNGLARELRRAGFRKVFDGQLMWTPLGNQRLWAVRNIDRLLAASREDIKEIFTKERAAAVAMKEKF